MIKELTASLLLTTSIGISNAQLTATYTKSMNYGQWGQTYTETDYYEDQIEAQRVLRLKTPSPTSNIDGVSKVQSFSICYDWYDSTEPTDKRIRRIYTYTYVENRAITINRFEYSFLGNIVPYSNYNSISREFTYFFGIPDNQYIVNTLNGNAPYTYDEILSMTRNVGINNPTWTLMPTVTTINDLKETVAINLPFQETFYVVDRITIVYDDSLISTPIPQDLNDFPNQQFILIQYKYEQNNNAEVVDIPGILFEILGMPFAWISTAFNLTIFPNTMYEVNISHIIMAVVIGGIAIFIIKRILH